MIQRKNVSKELEEGRQIIDVSKLSPHYQIVSREILREVPYVHLGYLYTRLAYNKRKLQVNDALMSRNNSNVMAFQPR